MESVLLLRNRSRLVPNVPTQQILYCNERPWMFCGFRVHGDSSGL